MGKKKKDDEVDLHAEPIADWRERMLALRRPDGTAAWSARDIAAIEQGAAMCGARAEACRVVRVTAKQVVVAIDARWRFGGGGATGVTRPWVWHNYDPARAVVSDAPFDPADINRPPDLCRDPEAATAATASAPRAAPRAKPAPRKTLVGQQKLI